MSFTADLKHSPRSLRFAVMLLFVLFITAETVIRVIDPSLNEFRSICFADDINSARIFINDPILHWRLRPDTKARFLETDVRVNSHGFRGRKIEPNKRRILFLGNSTTFGWKMPEALTFPSLVEQYLNNRENGSESWQSINAGVPGYSSHQVMLLAEEILKKLQVEYVVVCIGNNDAWPAEQSDAQIYEANRWKSHIQVVLFHSKVLLWLRDIIQPAVPLQFTENLSPGSIPRVNKQDYISNINQLLSVARRHGAKIIVLSPPVNLLYPPHHPGVSGHRREMLALKSKITEMFRHQRIDAAMALINHEQLKFPERSDILWMNGLAVTLKNDFRKGRMLLEEALEKNPFPNRCKRSYRNALLAYVNQKHLTCLDINRLFNPDPDQYQSYLFLDWCHPTASGHDIIATALLKIILQDDSESQLHCLEQNKTDKK